MKVYKHRGGREHIAEKKTEAAEMEHNHTNDQRGNNKE
jgi:hypothetical protein